jgi:cytochrome c-type biogenesis protein CcmH/NrfF
MSRRLALFALLSLLLAPASAAAMGAAGAGQAKVSLPVIERQVMCVTCKIPLDVAESPQADREKAFIQVLVNEGKNETQIKRELVAQYGPTVLGLPAAKGFDLTVYLVPVAVVLALAGLFLTLLPRWRRAARAQAEAQSEAPALAPADAARLESDLARFD